MKKRACQTVYTCLFFSFLLFLVIQPFFCQARANPGRNLPQPSVPPGKAKFDPDIIPGQYIVKFTAPSLSVYQVGVSGLPPTSPLARQERKLDASRSDSRNYLNYLRDRQADTLQSMEQALGRGISVTHSFKAAFNGVAVKMSPAEARRIARLPGIAAVIPDKMRWLHTDNGPRWIGADDLWGGTVSAATKGEGVVIGVIDTGINPANPSFADVGGDGYDHSNPRARRYGFCDSDHPEYDPAFPCNDKLIGAYDFSGDTVLYDNNGHGSHTAGTAAGNVVNDASIIAPTITLNRTIAGVAPHSNITSYKACSGNGCELSALLAAIDQATLDGVDVINYSIGGAASDPWNDADSEAFLNARQAGIFVVTSAGNSGPGNATVGSPGNAPWLLTVGNSSHDRSFSNSLTALTRLDGTSLPAVTGRSMTGALAFTGIVYAGDYGDPLCLNSFASGTFSGQIVVCDRGTNARVEKGSNVLAGGAGGYILANDVANGDSLVGDPHVLPAVHITYTDGVALKAWLAASSNHQAAIAGTSIDENVISGDVMTSSSSRGANSPAPGIIKPDVSAPGLDILAANGTDNAATWGLMTGTSMSSPHAAGAAALLISLHPDWSPAEIQSALMTTAYPAVRKEDGAAPADPFDTGTGRIDVSRAAQAGFVLDETYAAYLAADPSRGGDPKTINIPSLGREDIVNTTSWTRTLTSTAVDSITWTASVNNPAGGSLAVDPPSFTIAAGGEQQVTITADSGGAALDTWLFGSVLFTPDGGDVAAAQLPVALKRVVSTLPDSLRYADVRKTSFAIEKNHEVSGAITNLTVTRNGLAAATVHKAQLYQDPTPGDPFDGNWDPDDSTNKDGLWVRMITVPAGSKRLVTEIVATGSPDIDMYLFRWTGSDWEWHCTSAAADSNEYCSINDPPAGDYYVWVQNWAASDPGGTLADKVELATAVVPDASTGNLAVSLAGGGASVVAGQPFDLKISWNLAGNGIHWYGRFGLGTDGGNPDNLGLINLDIHARSGSLFFPIKGKEGKTSVILLK
ncbi:MAG: S8 family serine peptidase [Desulfobulbaceae bacterium]|nr:S8 family serine peptidase [Desulfobulbaceae bacterium]